MGSVLRVSVVLVVVNLVLVGVPSQDDLRILCSDGVEARIVAGGATDAANW